MRAAFAALGAAEVQFAPLRRRVERAGSRESQDGHLGRRVESARNKVHEESPGLGGWHGLDGCGARGSGPLAHRGPGLWAN